MNAPRIEGVIANKLFLEQLWARNDILCLQEHWLWDFQKEWIQKDFSGFKSFSRCHDINDPITNSTFHVDMVSPYYGQINYPTRSHV